VTVYPYDFHYVVRTDIVTRRGEGELTIVGHFDEYEVDIDMQDNKALFNMIDKTMTEVQRIKQILKDRK